MRICLALLLFISVGAFGKTDESLIAKEVTIKLQNPTYKDGILFTIDGGVIENSDIRIQAKSIQYTRKGQIHRIEAEGDLLIRYKKRIFIGSELQYDFLSKTGVVYDAKTSIENLYIGAEQIELNTDGSFDATDAFMTTCENKDSTWNFRTAHVHVTKNKQIITKNTTFRILDIPVLWVPYLRMNLKKNPEPILEYDLKWDSGIGPRASIRYQFYSWKDLSLYGRLEYRWSVGWGGALESEYYSTKHKTHFVTRSYLAKDRLESAPNAQQRYRLVGDFKHESKNDRSLATLTWDKYSDVRMQSDFRTEDFEVTRAKKTAFYLRHRDDAYITSIKVRPKINSFESIKQDLPTGFFAIPPIQLGKTGIYSTSLVKASYLDFSYSTQLISRLPDYRSGRIEVKEKFYRPIHTGPITITPLGGLDGIFYTNSATSNAKWFGVLGYGMKAESRAIKSFAYYKHHIEPYIEYSGLTKPSVNPDNHYIFSIQDGLDKINQVKAGVKNLFFAKNRPGKEALFNADIYANAFFADFAIPQLIPYGYLNLSWNLPSVLIDWKNSWNFREKTLHYSNARLKWTINENIAFSLEGRYRSRFDWRKGDHDNFILDVNRSQSELLLSPLSDRRVTLLSNIFIRLNPFWECSIQSHHGFYRLNQPPYNEMMVDIVTWLNSALKLHISYRYTDYTKPNFPHHFSFDLELIK
jgi:hypothetical protein